MNELMIPMMRQRKIDGRNRGSVIRPNRRPAPAPSIAAASWSSRGIDWSPASRITMKKPTICQMAATMTAGMAQSGESRKGIPRSTTPARISR